MLKALIAAAMLSLGFASAAAAQNCPAYPYTLTNGTTADANQVMGDFNSIKNCAVNTSQGVLTNGLLAGYTGMQFGSGLFWPNASGFLSGSRGGIITPYTDDNVYFDNYNSDGSIYFRGPSYSMHLAINAAGNVSVGSLPSSSYTFLVSGQAGGTGAWVNFSDSRLKTNIQTITGALALVQQLRGVRFQWRTLDQLQPGKPDKDGKPTKLGGDLRLPQGQTQVGFIAQEVAQVVPEAILTPADASSEVYGVKEGDLVPLLVQAIKEQQVLIKQLQTDVAALKAAH
jgi:hypothetical protein